jgi:hypothetical protein
MRTKRRGVILASPMTLGCRSALASSALASLVSIGPLALLAGCRTDEARGVASTPEAGPVGSVVRPEGALDAGATPSGAGGASDASVPGLGGGDEASLADAGTPPGDANASGREDGGNTALNGAGTEAGGASPCANQGLLFCDDFEAATTTTPPAPWSTSIIGNGTVTVDGVTPAHSGTKSIHVSDGDSDYDTLLVLHDASVLPAPAGRFYVRAFIRLGAAMSAGHNTFVLADRFVSQGQGNDLRLGEDDQMLMYTVMGDAHGALSNASYYDDGMMPGVQFPPATWTCLEVLLDSTKPEIDVWVDGKEVPDLHHTDFPLDDYDNVRFGFEKYAGPAMDVWYDDIAIGTGPIGCD